MCVIACAIARESSELTDINIIYVTPGNSDPKNFYHVIVAVAVVMHVIHQFWPLTIHNFHHNGMNTCT